MKKNEPKRNVIAGILVGVSIISFILYAVQKVLSGKGLNYYLTSQGVQMNYIGFLLTLCTLAVALFVGWIVKIWFARKKTLDRGHSMSTRDHKRKTRHNRPT